MIGLLEKKKKKKKKRNIQYNYKNPTNTIKIFQNKEKNFKKIETRTTLLASSRYGWIVAAGDLNGGDQLCNSSGIMTIAAT